MCCTPTIRLLIVLTLPPCCRCPLNRGAAPRLVLPRSRLERSDFVRWHKREVPTPSSNVRVYGHSGKHILVLSSSHFDPKQTYTSLRRLDILVGNEAKSAAQRPTYIPPHDLPLLKMPERTALASQSPGIRRMSAERSQ